MGWDSEDERDSFLHNVAKGGGKGGKGVVTADDIEKNLECFMRSFDSQMKGHIEAIRIQEGRKKVKAVAGRVTVQVTMEVYGNEYYDSNQIQFDCKTSFCGNSPYHRSFDLLKEANTTPKKSVAPRPASA